MEFVKELFMTIFVAIVFSFIVAKLISIAMVSDVVVNETVIEEVNFGSGLKVERTSMRRKFVRKVCEFDCEISADNELCDNGGCGEVSGVVGLPDKSPEGRFDIDDEGREMIGELESGVEEESIEIGLDELVVEEKRECTKDEAAATAAAAAAQLGINIKEEILMANDLENLVVKENECIQFDDVVKEEIRVANGLVNLVIDEKIIENAKRTDEIMELVVKEKDCITREADDQFDDGVNEEIRAATDSDNLVMYENEKIIEKANRTDEIIELDGDWEGIERSELEEVFGMASNYYISRKEEEDMLLGNDVKMMLYGLHKVAMEGPCHEPQPMVLKLSARAKWNEWQKLGNMSPEVAMEEYISLLSDRVPGWMEACTAGYGKLDSSEFGMPSGPVSTNEGKVEVKIDSQGGHLTGDTTYEDKSLTSVWMKSSQKNYQVNKGHPKTDLIPAAKYRSVLQEMDV